MSNLATSLACVVFGFVCFLNADEIWEQDLSSDMKIGISVSGFKRVDLKCGADAFFVNVTLDDDFDGVVYTRGSFSQKKGPCFKRHEQHLLLDGKTMLISMKIPFEKCQTVMDVSESRYSNTLIIQHDSELIMPGDAAFALDCSFEPEFKMSSGMSADATFKSKITLVDADPSATPSSKPSNQDFTAHSETENVSFVSPKDEL